MKKYRIREGSFLDYVINIGEALLFVGAAISFVFLVYLIQ